MLGRPVLITLVLLAGTLGLAALLRPRVNVSELRRAIARDLTPGTSAVRIETYLDSLGISHSTARPSGLTRPGWTIVASVQDWRRPHVLSDGIFLEFRLDTSFALVQAEVHESWTMP